MSGRVVRLAWLTALATAVVVAGGTASADGAGSGGPRWPAHVDWERYVEAPTTADVGPVHIVRTSGTVSGARALAGGGGGATLTMRAGGPAPTIVVDYGRDVGGVPYFVVRSESGSPVLRSAYSEGLAYLKGQGDDAPSQSGAGDPARVDSLTIASTGHLTTGLIQGGERYERISLASPGTVTLSSVGIHFTAVRATADDYRGWFDSSSGELNRIWYAGAYTTQLDELPAGSLPRPWTISAGALVAHGGVYGVLRTGSSWANYTMSFDTRISDNSAGWVVRASSTSGYLLVLDDATDKTDVPDTLREIAYGPAEFASIGDVALPRTVVAGGWHQVKTVVNGTDITTSIDGRQVSSIDTASLPPGASTYATGSIGFAAVGSTASYRDLDVSNPAGVALYANDLDRPSALAAFSGPDVTVPDPLPVIMDGAKRDRVVWSGDLGVESPNVFYTTGSDGYVKGSLQLLASYQAADGESGSNVPPTVPLGQFPESGYTYSAPYSMDEVDNIATYFLYTGDLSFVRAQWPMITRELAYNQSMVDSRGLLETDAGNGMDWDYYDGAKVGEVSAYNDLYYRTLTDAATLAQALGLAGEAAQYAAEASDLRSAINRDLFDPTTGLYPVSDLQAAVAQDANSLAVLFGVAPQDRDTAILAALARALPSTPYGPLPFGAGARYMRAVSPFVTNEEVEARFATGDTDSALSLLRTLWGYMIAPGPDDTGADWELVGAHGAPGFGSWTSLAHGWASGATADLSAYVLGVQPVTAGFRSWSVAPHPGSLSWVEGDVPTPHGTIEVRWAQDHASGRFTMEVRAPAGTKGTIAVPVPRSGARVTVGIAASHRPGRVTTSVPGATSVTVAVGGGATYDVEVTTP